ncbi:MAG: triose-phosphate isomerase [Planctomycetota bacterium]
MRRPLIAGNWKMNLNKADSIALVQGLVAASFESQAEVLVCPTHVYLDAVCEAVEDSGIVVGGQDVYFEGNGAFTGETSTSMLCDLGCQFVILGHSERRNVIGETDDLINKKMLAALEAGLTPVLCVGELLEQRESGQTMDVVRSQLEGSLANVTEQQMQNVVIAYEPVWAIGTGKTATPEQAQAVHADIRKLISERYNSDVAEATRILYGGSVKPANAAELLTQPDIDGALVGGASLTVENFLPIVNAAV